MNQIVEAYLQRAWTQLAPGRNPEVLFPQGFWPDVARVAVHLALDIPLDPDFRPTRCTRGNWPEPTRADRQKSSGKISAAQKAANTATLLAGLKGPTA